MVVSARFGYPGASYFQLTLQGLLAWLYRARWTSTEYKLPPDSYNSVSNHLRKQIPKIQLIHR